MNLRHRIALATLRFALKRMNIHVRGLENVPTDAGRPLIAVANHQSLLDAVILNGYLSLAFNKQPTFLVDTAMHRAWPVRFATWLAGNHTFPLDPTNPLALRGLIRHLQADPATPSVIFPEGRLTRTGKLMKTYDGTGLVADKLDALLVPLHISGAEASRISHVARPWKTRLRARITVTALPPVELPVPEGLTGKARRRALGTAMQKVLTDSMFAAADTRHTLWEELLRSAKRHGRGHVIAKDLTTKITYGRLIMGATALGGSIAAFTRPGEAVAVMLPNAVGALVTFFALQKTGRVPAMVNFTSGRAAIVAGCKAAGVTQLLTSRLFVEKAALEGLMAELESELAVHYLEDIRAEIGWKDKLAALREARRLKPSYAEDEAVAAAYGVILFTSGSEGAPKAVALSHANLLANRWQAASRLDVNPTDRVLNALPLFHSFGLGVGMLLPVFEGIPVFLYPSPLHVRMVPEMVYDNDTTITFGTDTFLSRYAAHAHPYDFRATRLVFSGAEKLRDETRRVYMEKFGLRVLEGYGTTEASPVVAMNSPLANKAGTVGHMMPGLDWKLEPVAGIETGGRLFIKGPNVMQGYLKDGQVQPLEGGWYDTGDIVDVDGAGFVSILGRAKRFAKVGGEMVSLTAVEGFLNAHWPSHQHAIMTLPDAKKGEKLVLMTTLPALDRAELAEKAKKAGLPELFVPRDIKLLKSLPLLATGKPDYPALQKMLQEG